MTNLTELEARIDALEKKVNGDASRYTLNHLLQQLGEEMEQLREIVTPLQEEVKKLAQAIRQDDQAEGGAS